MWGEGLVRGKEVVKKFTEMEDVLLGLELRELVPAFRELKEGLEEIFLMKEEDNVEVGWVDKVGMVKRLLVGEAETHKVDWAKSSLPSILSDHRRQGLMLNTPSDTATVANIAQHAKYLQANIRPQAS